MSERDDARRGDAGQDDAGRDGAGRDDRAARRDARKQAERDRMAKHGARTGTVYRDAILKRLRDNAGKGKKRRKRR